MFCTKCSAWMADDSKYCTSCGAAAAKYEYVCGNCKMPMKRGQEVCDVCGKRGEGVFRGISGEVVNGALPGASAASDPTCPNCGSAIASESRFCRYCGNDVAEALAKAQEEAASPSYCWNCGKEVQSSFMYCPSCEAPQAKAVPSGGSAASAGFPTVGAPSASASWNQAAVQSSPAAVAPGAKSKIAAGLLAIFLGGWGIHKFYLGYSQAGGTMLAIWFVAFFIGLFIPAIGTLIILALCIIALIEGIMYLTKTDQAFYETYVVGKKEWF